MVSVEFVHIVLKVNEEGHHCVFLHKMAGIFAVWV